MSNAIASNQEQFQLTQDEIDTLIFKPDERRSHTRFADHIEVRIAPLVDDKLPLESFQKVVGRDISKGGVSFFMKNPTYFTELDIELVRGGNRICLRAEALSSVRMVGLEPYSLVSCRFTGRASR